MGKILIESVEKAIWSWYLWPQLSVDNNMVKIMLASKFYHESRYDNDDDDGDDEFSKTARDWKLKVNGIGHLRIPRVKFSVQIALCKICLYNSNKPKQ